MASILAFFQGHGIVLILAIFAFASTVLSGIAALLQAMGKAVPGWIGSVLSVLASITHFINGNFSGASSAAAQASAPAAPSA